MANERIYKITINGVTESVTQIDTLLEKLNELDKKLGEITKQGVKIKIGRGDVDIDNSQLEEGVKTLASMRKELSQMKKEFIHMEIGTDKWKSLRDQIFKTNNEVKSVEQSIGVFSRNVGNYTNSFLAAFDKFPASVKETLNGLKSFNSEAVTLEEKIRTVQKSMSELGGSKIDTEPYKALEEVLHNLEKESKIVKDTIDDAKDRTGGIKDVAEVFQDATGVVQVFAGAMSMLGGESEDTVKAIKKLQEIQTIANGMKQLSTSVQQSGALWKVWQAMLSGADKVLALLPARFRAVTAAEAATAAGARTATVAMNGLRAAIAGTGIGLAVVIIGALVSKLMEMGDAVDEATDHFKTMNDYISGTLQHTLDKIDFKKSLGQLTELGAAKESLNATQEAVAELEKELNGLADTMGKDWWEWFDKNFKDMKLDFNTKEANDAFLRFQRTLRQGVDTAGKAENALNDAREASVALGKDGAKNADKANDAVKSFVQVLEQVIQGFQRIKLAEMDLAKTTRDNFAESISNPFLRQIELIRIARDEATKAYKAQLKEDASNKEEIEQAIASVEAKYRQQERDAYKSLLEAKDRLDMESRRNKLEAERDSLNKRLGLINLEEEAAIKSYEREAKEALYSAKEISDGKKAIEEKYEAERKNARLEWERKTNAELLKLRMDFLKEWNNMKLADINLAEQIFNADELDKSFNRYRNELIKDIGNMNNIAEMATNAIGIPALGKGYDPTKEWTKPDNFGKEWSKTLIDTLKYSQEEAYKIMEKIESSFIERLTKANVDVSGFDKITKEIQARMQERMQKIEETVVDEEEKTNQLQLLELDAAAERVNYLVDLIYNNKKKLDEGRNAVETYAESLVGSLALVSNGLYDINKGFPERIQEVNEVLKEQEGRYKEYLNKRFENQKAAEIREYDLLVSGLTMEKDARLQEIDQTVVDTKEREDKKNQIVATYNLQTQTAKKNHDAKMLQLENDYTNEVNGIVSDRYEQLDALYGEYSSELQIKLTQLQRHSTNSWNIVNISKVRRELRMAKEQFKKEIEDIKKLVKELDEELSKGIIDDKTYEARYKAFLSRANEAENNLEDIEEQSQQAVSDFVSSINTYVSAALNGITQISSAVFDAQSQAMDEQMEKLENENSRLEDILSKQQEIIEDHTSNINDIEGELATARGDRRDQLVDALNEEKLARERAYAEEQRIEKQKEANERKMRELDDKRDMQQYKQQILQAHVSTALAVTNALATQPFIPVGVAMGSLAAALGAAQIAIMSSNKPTRYKKGGLLDGKSHEQGGIKVAGFDKPIELEGNEYIINKRTTQYNLPLLEFINHSKKRIDVADLIDFYYSNHSNGSTSSKSKYASGGKLPTPNVIDIGNQQTHIYVDYDQTPIVVSVEEINRVQEHLHNVKVLAGAI